MLNRLIPLAFIVCAAAPGLDAIVLPGSPK